MDHIPCLRVLLIQKESKHSFQRETLVYSLRVLLIQKESKLERLYEVYFARLRVLLIQKESKPDGMYYEMTYKFESLVNTERIKTIVGIAISILLFESLVNRKL